jgi:hypothetical protein
LYVTVLFNSINRKVLPVTFQEESGTRPEYGIGDKTVPRYG